ncbi:MAG: YlmC/YmxH family sporulation protein [Clostridia bacterium]|nr:YlmC/YmxH family sporulation protein [Clostridia bacterium]
MSEIGELSYSELRQKDIVSISDGRKLGKIVDLVFSPSGKVKGIVAPYGRRFLCFRNQEVYIPYINIKTIGEDIILVDVDTALGGRNCRADHRYGANIDRRDDRREESPLRKHSSDESQQNRCDGRCDKCMLFDCEDRWKGRANVYIDNAPYN